MKPIIVLICMSFFVEAFAQSRLNYPVTRKDPAVVDNYFGTQVADPYRWLEDDRAPETQEWVKKQNDVTYSYLSGIPFRDKIRERLRDIWNYERTSAPFKEGGYYFIYKNNGLQNQSVLHFMKNIADKPEVLLDPNTFSKDGTASLSGFSVKKDGKYAAYSISEGGSDWNTIHVISLPDKKKQPDVIKWVKFSGIAWWKDGFFYSRFPETSDGDELTTSNSNQKVYYHKLGTSQDQDVLIYEDPANPLLGAYAGVTEDEKYLVISISRGTYGNSIKIRELNKDIQTTIIDDFDNESGIVGNDGDILYLFTNIGAPNNRLVKVDPATPERENWQPLIAEDPKNVLSGASLVDDKWFCTYIVDASSQVKVFDKEGKYLYSVELPAIGSVGGFGGKKTDKELFYSFTSYNYPTTIYRYDTEKNISSQFLAPKVKFNPAEYEVKQVFYPSKDGTKIPMFIVYKKGLKLDGTNPTLLYGYGGFDISLLPSFSISNVAFLEKGGVYAVANLRGGGEYGEKWHKAGMLLNKQNVFDDFIAAAEYLVSAKYTSASRLAIHGRSNGGLLVGAVMTQRPDICRVALPGVGVLDMLRYHKFTIGHAWAVEYGSSDEKEHFTNLYKYSPLHNLKSGVEYPATMVLTADHDDRVVPAHSFKFAATLQEKYTGNSPVLIRIDVNAGHGAGKSTEMLINEAADFWSFVLHNLGVSY